MRTSSHAVKTGRCVLLTISPAPTIPTENTRSAELSRSVEDGSSFAFAGASVVSIIAGSVSRAECCQHAGFSEYFLCVRARPVSHKRFPRIVSQELTASSIRQQRRDCAGEVLRFLAHQQIVPIANGQSFNHLGTSDHGLLASESLDDLERHSAADKNRQSDNPALTVQFVRFRNRSEKIDITELPQTISVHCQQIRPRQLKTRCRILFQHDGKYLFREKHGGFEVWERRVSADKTDILASHARVGRKSIFVESIGYDDHIDVGSNVGKSLRFGR